jgi:ethanolamine utilization protein EutN
MLFGRVRGTAICTIKYPDLKGMKLLIVQPLDKNLDPVGALQVAVDVVQAGVGDLCVLVRSREAALALQEHKFVPVDLAIIGIVDELVVHPDNEFDYTLKEGWVKYT